MSFLIANHKPRLLTAGLLTALAILMLGVAIPYLFSRASLSSEASGKAKRDFGNLPLAFQTNFGQADESVRYSVQTSSGTFYFSPTDVKLLVDAGRLSGQPELVSEKEQPGPLPIASSKDAGPPTVMQLSFLGANPSPQITGGNMLEGKVNYLLGNDPSKWHTNLPLYGTVTYKELYPGIDLVYNGNGKELKGTYLVAPGADPSLISWSYTDSRLSIDNTGNLLIRHPAETSGTANAGDLVLTEQAPVATQTIKGHQVPVAIGYQVSEKGTASFNIGSYDRSVPLEIDPTLLYSTFFGGANNDRGNSIAVDAAGNIYLEGDTGSINFPLANAFQNSLAGGADLFVSKLSPDGSTLLYSTYLGGRQGELATGIGIAVDGSGNAYVTGATQSVDFPVLHAIQGTSGGGWDVFVAKLDQTGSNLVYSTYLGGSGNDYGYGITVDTGGRAYVTGATTSLNFPTHNPLQATNHGQYDAFESKLAPDGSSLVYSTFIGGNLSDFGYGITLDAVGDPYITGGTDSSDYPVFNALQPTIAGARDAIITELNPSGTTLLYSTYLGGHSGDFGNQIALDASGNIYVAGSTFSNNFPVVHAFQATFHGGMDEFLSKVNAAGSTMLYSTYIGGSEEDDGVGMGIGSNGLAYVTGLAYSSDFPLVDSIENYHTGPNIVLTALDTNSTNALYSTYLGSGIPYGMTSNREDKAYIIGLTEDPDFRVENPIQPVLAGGQDAVVLEVSNPHSASPTPTATVTSVPACGLAWRYVPSLDAGKVEDLAAISGQDIWAVGWTEDMTGQPHPFIMHWDGTGWQNVSISETDGGLEGIEAISDNDVWAVGYSGLHGTRETVVLHWDGATWTRVTSPNPGGFVNELYAITAVSANDMWAFGEYWRFENDSFHTLAMHWDGSSWTVLPTPDPFDGILRRGVAIASNDVWAVGSFFADESGRINLAIHWDGSSWTMVDSAIESTSSNLWGIAAISANDVWAVGDNRVISSPPVVETLALHWNGTVWTQVPTPNVMGRSCSLSSVDALGADDIWAVGACGNNTLTVHWDGTAWSIVPSPNRGYDWSNGLNSVEAISSTDVWAVGAYRGFLQITERFSNPCTTTTITPSATRTRTATAEVSVTIVSTATPITTATAAPTECTISFSDVPEGSTFYPYVRCLACLGIISGYADGTFRPNSNVTRGQAAKIIANSVPYNDAIPPDRQTFTDVPSSNPFWRYIERAALHGAVSGYADGTYRPGNNLTRGQIAKIDAIAAGYADPIPPARQTFSDVPPGSPFWLYVERVALHGAVSGYDDGTYRPGNNVTRGQASKIVANTFFPDCAPPGRTEAISK